MTHRIAPLILTPALAGRMAGPPRLIRRLAAAFPPATVVPAYLIGVGLRPERAPDFARRAPVTGAAAPPPR